MTAGRNWFLLWAVVMVTACSSTQGGVNPATAVEPQLSVERFLQAVNTRDLEAMGRLFGTADGPLGDTGSTIGCAFKKIGSWFGGEACRSRQEIELRLDAIASILEHQDYTVTRQQRVAGRRHPTSRVLVDLVMDEERVVRGVPFVVVNGGNGRWFVEEVDLELVMEGA
ncbi:MAG: hypothetical protein U5R14_05620 [Gemmatimonadota bacterium]|nr:hypothetical protein [Gemmatimonadota bacterium]